MNENQYTHIMEQLARLETKLEAIEEFRAETQQTKADATKALAIATENKHDIEEVKINHEKDISSLESNNKWAWTFIITFALGVVMYLVEH